MESQYSEQANGGNPGSDGVNGIQGQTGSATGTNPAPAVQEEQPLAVKVARVVVVE